MNQEIEGKLREILDAVSSEYPTMSHEKAIKAIQELVCSTVPEKETGIIVDDEIAEGVKYGWNHCRTEILKKWS